jgi:hypothetical protein
MEFEARVSFTKSDYSQNWDDHHDVANAEHFINKQHREDIMRTQASVNFIFSVLLFSHSWFCLSPGANFSRFARYQNAVC